MKQIKDDIELCHFDGVDAVEVYKGSFDNLEKASLKWRIADEKTCRIMGMEIELLKLSEIVEQLSDADMITIFIEEPLKGKILQYGNYGKSWYEIGTTCGYA